MSAASLREPQSLERKADHYAAGVYLRLAYSLSPKELEDWHLHCFCSAVEEVALTTDSFWEGFSALPGLQSLDRRSLRQKIKIKCPRP